MNLWEARTRSGLLRNDNVQLASQHHTGATVLNAAVYLRAVLTAA